MKSDSNNVSNNILSDITVFNKYAKYVPELNRRETWSELVSRYLNMMSEKYPNLKNEIWDNGSLILEKKVLPSMRALQFAGKAISKNNSRIYNCAYLPMDHYQAFSEVMFLLLGGTGIGYSVQFHHVDKLPRIQKPTKNKKYLIGDSLEGWADAIKVLFKSYYGAFDWCPRYDFSDIRHKGVRLVTAGGKAPGPEPLRICLTQIQCILDRKENGDKLTPIEVHDINCHIANAVLSGGIRRSAMIALFSFDDNEMLTCKYGNWWESNEQRGRANNSAVILRNRIKKKEFNELWKKIEISNAGEPGIYFTNDIELGTNPCCEISLKAFQFCNLCEMNVSNIESYEDAVKRAKAAAFFGTLQAGFTDFHYLRDIWKKTTEKEALIGVGMTGIASNKITEYDLKSLSEEVKNENDRVSKLININHAARTTTIKPSGTTSCVLGTSSGIHAWHNDYYVRRMRIMKNDPLYLYMKNENPSLIEDDKLRSHDTAVISIPQKAPEGSILRTESAFDLLERVKKFNIEWVHNGHRVGNNTNNVSATISLKPEEWHDAGDWIWSNKSSFNGLSVLPYSGGSYIQAPFEDVSEEQYNKMVKKIHNIDLTKVIEIDDNTEHSQEIACAGGACEVI